jgi:hypothetical protein
MFFNLFGGKKGEETTYQFNDVTYISEQAKNDAVVKYAAQNDFAICIAWFPETASRYKELFIASGIDESRVAEARNYSSLKYPGKQIVFLEHYPLHEKEKEFVQDLQQKSFVVYNSLTEPILWAFGGQKIVDLMRRMGMKDDEPVAHAMISKSIRRAQEKLASSITVEQSGASQAEWFKRNFPDK